MDQKAGRKMRISGGHWLRPHRVANFLDCSKDHVYDLVHLGELEAIRLGVRDIRISEESLQKFLDRQKLEAGEE